MTQEEAWQILGEYRKEIDSLDHEIARCLHERARIAMEIGRVKKSAGLPVFEANREDQVIRNVSTQVAGPMPSDAMRRIFEQVMKEMRALQETLRAAHS